MQEAQQMKPVVWVGDSKRRLKAFPEDVQDEIGFALNRAQWGRTHRNAKSLRGFSGVLKSSVIMLAMPIVQFTW
jgi:phage-related protein